MAENQTTWGLKLDDQISSSANAASQALGKLQDSIKKDTKALSDMQAAMKRMQSSSVVNISAARELQKKIDAQKEKIAQAQSKFVELGGSFDKTYPKAKRAASGVEALKDKLKELPAMSSMARTALLGFAGSVVAGIGALAAFGFASVGARRDELLHLEALTRVRSMWGFARGNATEYQAEIDRVSQSSALGRGKLAEYAEQLHKAGLRGQNFQDALEGMSIMGSTLGDAAAQRFRGIAASAAFAGGSVRALLNDRKARFGDIAAQQAMSVGVQFQKLKENLSGLFDSLNIGPLLAGINQFVGMFNKATTTGRILSDMMGRMFRPFIDGVGHSGNAIENFFYDVLIGALRIENGLLRMRLWFKRTFGDVRIFEGMQRLPWLKAMFVALGVAVVVAIAPFALLAAKIALVVAGIAVLIEAGQRAYDWFRNASWAEIGTAVIDGMIEGLTGGASRVFAKITGIGNGMADALRRALGIHSPSRVFADLGKQIPAGVEVGINRGSSRMNSAVGEMVDVPSEGGGRRGSSVAVSINEVHVHAGHTSEPRELAESFVSQLANALEGLTLQVGAA